MGKILGIAIRNYGTLKDIKMGRIYADGNARDLGNMVAIIGPSGNGKSTLADAFGFIADALATDVEAACDKENRGGYEKLHSQGCTGPISFELYYRENSNSRPITYELSISADSSGRPYVREERLRQRQANQSYGRPLSFLHLVKGIGYAFVGKDGGQDDKGNDTGEKVDVALSDTRKLGIVTLGAMKQYSRIEQFLNFLKSWYLCYFSPDASRRIQSAVPTPYLDRYGSNLNNVAQYMYRENPKEFKRILSEIQTKIPSIRKIQPVKMPNGQMVLEFFQDNFREPFYSQRMSDGTLKLFAYYLLLHESNPRQLVFIEEPENGLYHQYLADLAREMAKNVGNGYTKQLFVTTHSPFFVNSLPPEDVWVLEKGADGFSTAKCASEYAFVPELVQEGAELGNLWNSKFFG